MSAERWLPVVGFEGYYEVSDHGSVRSVDRVVSRRPGRWPKNPAVVQVMRRGRGKVLNSGPQGHPRLGLYKGGQYTHAYVHALMLAAFVGPRPEGMVTRHLDGNPTNNVLPNLAYGTSSENMQDCLRHGTHAMASKTHCIHGHEFTPENTRTNRDGSRTCRACCTRRNLRVTERRRAMRLAS